MGNSQYSYEEYFDQSYFTVGGDRGWYNEWAFALENEWHREFAEYVCGILNMPRVAKVLDLGCARGNVVHWLCAFGYDAYGVDVSRWATEHSWEPHRVKCANIVKGIPFDSDFFDFAVSRETFEHISEKDIRNVISNVASILKTDGLLFFEVATNRSGKEEKKKRDSGNADPSHVLIKSLTWWRELLEDTGLFRIDLERSFNAMHSDMGYRYGWDILILERL